MGNLLKVMVVTVLCACNTAQLQPPGKIDLSQILDADLTSCEHVMECMLDYCDVPSNSHEARQAAMFDGCFQVCSSHLGDGEDVDRAPAWELYRCETEATAWGERCDELVDRCGQ